MRRVRAFGHFWWDFVVGDDWRVRGGRRRCDRGDGALVAGGIDAWWLMPVAVAARALAVAAHARLTRGLAAVIRRAPT